MKVFGWISTDKVGSRCTFEVHIPDDEGLDAKVVDEYVRDEMWNHAEYGWDTEDLGDGE